MLAEEMNLFKRVVNSIKIDKDTLKQMIKLKRNEINTEIQQAIAKREDELKRYVAHQKAENSRLSQQIYYIKSEKVTLQTQLNGKKN